MVALLSTLRIFGELSTAGKLMGRFDNLAKTVAHFIEHARTENLKRERELNVSQYRTYNEIADPFILVRIGPEDLQHPSQAWVLKSPVYALLRSECFELRCYLERDAVNEEAREKGETPPFDIGFDAIATLKAGLARLGDEKLSRQLSGTVLTPLSQVRKPEQEVS